MTNTIKELRTKKIVELEKIAGTVVSKKHTLARQRDLLIERIDTLNLIKKETFVPYFLKSKGLGR